MSEETDDVLRRVYKLIDDREKAVKERDLLREVIKYYESAMSMTYRAGCDIEIIDYEWRAAKSLSEIARAKGVL